MNLLTNNFVLTIISLILLTIALFFENTIIALVLSFLLGVTALINKKSGLFMVVVFFSLRPFVIEINPALKFAGDIMVFFLLVRTIYDFRGNIKELFKFQVFEYAYFIFGIVGTISALINDVGLTALLTQLRAYFLLYVVFYVVKRTIINKKDITQFSILTFSLAILISIHGIVEKISNKTILMPQTWENWSLSATNQIRVYGLLKGPNELALFLIISFLVSLLLLKAISGKKVLIYAGLTIITTTFLLTYSRGAFLCLISFLIVYVILKRDMKSLLPYILVFIISMTLFFSVNQASNLFYNRYLAVGPEVTTETVEKSPQVNEERAKPNRFKEAFSEETISLSSESGRIYYVKKALEVFKDYPLIGSGFATFGGSATLKYSSPIYEDYSIGYNFYSDNQYILILAETGVLGVIALLVIVVNLVLITWKKRKDVLLSPILIFFLTSTIVGGMLYNILENDSYMLYYFIVLGVACNLYPDTYKDNKTT